MNQISLHEPTFGEEEIQAVVDVMRSTRVTSGDKVREMEALFGPYAVMCNSGSSANLLAIAALCNPVNPMLKAGDGVIVSALSWSTTVWPLVQYGLVPIIVDIDPSTLNIDTEEIIKVMETKSPVGTVVKAIMPVHVYGNPCDMKAIVDIAERNDLLIIEDVCESLGAHGVGQNGNMNTYSFYFSHHITTLEGGMVVAKNQEDTDLLRVLRCHGWTREMSDPPRYDGFDPKFTFINAGYNLRVSEVNAAIGVIQHRKLAGFVATRRKNAAALQEMFAPYPMRTQLDCGSSWFGFPIVSHGTLRKHFDAAGIETRPIICGNIARQPGMKLWRHEVVGDLMYADEVMQHGFAIPCHQALTEEQLEYIAASAKDFYGR